MSKTRYNKHLVEIDGQHFRDLIVSKGLSIRKIAPMIGIDRKSLMTYFNRNSIPKQVLEDLESILEDDSPLIAFAKEEFERYWPTETRDSMQNLACKNVIDLLKVFSKQGHSGMSGSYVLSLFERLVRFKPIGPLTGEDDEWQDCQLCDGMQQNKRCGSVFRQNGDNGTAYDCEGVVFRDQEGMTFTSYLSSTPVKFPYNVPEHPQIVDIYKRRKPE